ncbi:MAG: hypothetical protein NXY57DRAFT_664438 [Lentinula lateritia]|nr:MAG: hypothetical protein NXY57DRAFT_664438 [Lentinula lateritia]
MDWGPEAVLSISLWTTTLLPRSSAYYQAQLLPITKHRIVNFSHPNLPSGNHTLFVNVADTIGNQTAHIRFRLSHIHSIV